MKNPITITYLPLLVAFLLFSSLTKCEPKEESGKERDTSDAGPVLESEYALSLDKNQASQVSDFLMGFNVIYPHEKNTIWQDGKIAGYLKEVNGSLIRYPGGTVTSYYHWNQLTGEGWKDSWDPANPVTAKAPSEFMDLDEYMNLVKATGATPLVGINMSSGWRWNRQEDGLKESIALMQYCKDRNFVVKYWFLDNEPYQHDSNGGEKSPEQYGDLINAYVPVMKAFDPTIKIIANWNAGFKNKRAEFEKLIQRAGANIDVLDAHWYWSWSDTSWEKWLSKTPMTQWTGETYEGDIRYFKLMVKDLGHPNIQLASLEWNTGPTKVDNSLTAPRAAFVHAEMMMQFISGGLDYAAFWPIHWPDEASKPRSLVNTSTNAANPNLELFKFLGKMQGGTLTGTPIIKAGKEMVSIAVQDAGQKTLRIGILNKNTKEMVTDIGMDQFPGMELKEAYTYQVSLDGSKYSIEKLTPLASDKAGIFKFLSNGISLTMLTFELITKH